MNTETIDKFAATHRGAVLGAGHPDYDEARKLYNGMIDKRPLMIARCSDVGDVIDAVNFGRDNKLAIAIRGGGHNGPGFGSVDGGLVIDMSTMTGVRVNPAARTVRVGPGCTTGDVDHATYAFGQAVPFGIISTTGVAGLTLSGGHGYLSRQYGLAIDSLIEADVVLADGSFVTASESQNADLLWALRGGGGNFGVVTSFLFRTHPAKDVYGGPIVFDLSDAPAVMRWYREFQASAPNDFCIWLGLQSVPSGEPFPPEHQGKRMCILLVAQGAAMVLERRLRQIAARRRDRCPYRAGIQGANRRMPDASLPDRRRRARQGKGRHCLELPRRDLVDGDRRDRPRRQPGLGAEEVGKGLLAGYPSLRSRWRLSELHDG
jgi:FAD/FMN-containing dehydrogenase